MFKHNVRDDQILRQKLQISNLFVLEINLMSHSIGTATDICI
jgi:hypothetical protein